MSASPAEPPQGPSGPGAPGPGQPGILRRTSLGATFARTLAIVFLVFGIAQYFVIRGLTRSHLQVIERTNLLNRTRQVFYALSREEAFLQGITTSTAAWGDTYDYVAKPGPAYLEKAFGGEWPKIYDIDFVTMVGMDGRRVWMSDGYPSFKQRGPTVLTAERFALDNRIVFPHGVPFGPKEASSTLIGSPDGIWMLCSHAITSDDMSQPPRGVLIFGRLIDRETLDAYTYGQQDQVSFTAPGPAAGRRWPEDYALADEFPLFKAGRTEIYAEEQAFVSLTPVADALGRPLAALRLAIPRDIDRLGQRLIWIVSGSLFVMAILTLAVTLFVVRSLVIRPVARLAAIFAVQSEDRQDILRIRAEREDEIGFLAGRADELLIKVREQRTELERVANTDRLTGLANRRSFETHTRQELRRILRHRRVSAQHNNLAVVLIDVDHFKLFNDTYGHMAGDTCLRTIAEAIRACTHRPGDLACRFGGEEFILVLPDTAEEGALVVAEAVRKAVQALGMAHATSPVSGVVTVSLGVASAEVEERFDLDTLIGAADKALYAAKHGGRNRVVGSSAMPHDPDVAPASDVTT